MNKYECEQDRLIQESSNEVIKEMLEPKKPVPLSHSSAKKFAGFWYSKSQSDLPMPQANKEPWAGQPEFLIALDDLEDRSKEICYRGWSNCRICNKHNGSIEYWNGDWVWPEGFKHYIKYHNIKPDDEFIEFVFSKFIK